MRRHVKPRLPARVRRRALRGRRSRETTNTSGWHNPAACIRRSRGLHHARRRRAVANALTRSLLPVLCAFAPPREYVFSGGSAFGRVPSPVTYEFTQRRERRAFASRALRGRRSRETTNTSGVAQSGRLYSSLAWPPSRPPTAGGGERVDPQPARPALRLLRLRVSTGSPGEVLCGRVPSPVTYEFTQRRERARS